MFMKRNMRLKGHRIQVSEAEEPSIILWENFGYTRCGGEGGFSTEIESYIKSFLAPPPPFP